MTESKPEPNRIGLKKLNVCIPVYLADQLAHELKCSRCDAVAWAIECQTRNIKSIVAGGLDKYRLWTERSATVVLRINIDIGKYEILDAYSNNSFATKNYIVTGCVKNHIMQVVSELSEIVS